jgi:Caudovirus prohead serine protease
VSEWAAAKKQLDALVEGIDLDLDDDEDRTAEVQRLASERGRTGEPDGLRRKAVETAPTEAAITGEFEARVSDTLPDHEHERFTRSGLERAAQKLRESGRALPVLFGHNDRDIYSVVGMVPSDGLSVNDQDQLIARGWIDVMDNLGKKIHRMLRGGALRWSIGGFWKSSRQEGDTRVLELSELAELSIVPIPANPRVATTSLKNLSPNDLTDEELKQWAQAAGMIPSEKPMSLAALEVERQRILRDFGLDEASQRRNAERRKRADYAVMEATLREPFDAAEKREQRDRELRRKADQLRLEAALDFDTSLIETNAETGKRKTAQDTEGRRRPSGHASHEQSVRDLMIQVLTGEEA